jgi:hypothetical protein
MGCRGTRQTKEGDHGEGEEGEAARLQRQDDGGGALKVLDDLEARLGAGWDALVVDAVCAHYGLDRATMSLPPRAEEGRQERRQAEGRSGHARGEEEDGEAAGGRQVSAAGLWSWLPGLDSNQRPSG